MKTATTYHLTWSTPFGELTVCENEEKLTAVIFGRMQMKPSADTPLLQEARKQISAYYEGRLRDFDLPYDVSCGTEFQQKVWQALTHIPYGHTATYSDIAATIGNSRAVRAVGMANHRNPLPIIIPCHRIIGRDGSLTGYAGGLHIKRFLLELEQKQV